jgi:4,5-DOPA dioxygenase extradiol
MTALAPVFVSHGAPTLALEPGLAGPMLAGLARRLPRPRAVLVASAHWEAPTAAVSTTLAPTTIHDFGGFPAELYSIRYPAPGAPEVARAAAERVRAAGLDVREDPVRGLDHGAWVPLLYMYPDASIPVAQLALVRGGGPAVHLALGAALAPLTSDGVLVLGSGSLTHDLARVFEHAPDADPDPSVAEFVDWITARLAAGDRSALLDYRRRAPHAVAHHPSEEHLLPLFVALGAAGEGARMRRVPGGTTFGVLAMDAFVA